MGDEVLSTLLLFYSTGFGILIILKVFRELEHLNERKKSNKANAYFPGSLFRYLRTSQPTFG